MSVLMIMLISKAIFTGGIARYLIAARANDDNAEILQITSSTFVLNTIIAFIVLIFGLPFSFFIEHILIIDEAYHSEAHLMMGIMIFSFAFRLAFATFESGLIVEQRFVLINVIRLLLTLFRLILLLILILGISPRVIWVVIATEATNVLGISLYGFFSRRIIPSLRVKLRYINKKSIKKILSFGIWSFIGQIANRIRTAADPIILNQLAGAFDITIFYIGGIVPKHAYNIIEHATQSILPSLTAMHETKQHEKLARTYIRYGRIMTWLFLFIATPLIVLNKEVMTLYAGKQYVSAGIILLILLIAEMLRQTYSAIVKISYAMAKMKIYSLISISTQIINLVLTIILVSIYEMGAFGAALSTLIIRGAFEFWIFSIYGAQLIKIKYRKWFFGSFVRGVIPGICVIPFLLILRSIWIPENWLIVIAQSFFSFILYIIAVVYIASNKEDKNDLLRLLRWVRKRIKRE